MTMQFGRPPSEEPDINLIPFIDVLLVIMIFLLLTTTYGKLTQLELRLPQADSSVQQPKPQEITVTVSSDGRYTVQKNALPASDVQKLALALQQASQGLSQPMVVIAADARASHQSVIQVLEAAQQSGLPQVTFSTQSRQAPTSAP